MFRVLLADDEKTILEGLTQLINWDELGLSVVATAKNGLELIALTEKHKPHLIITDIKMPKMDGIEAIKQLRGSGYENEIILLTGYAEFEYAKTALEQGTAAYLMKPVDEDELTQRLIKVTEKLSEVSETEWREEAAYLHRISMHVDEVLEIPPKSLSVDDSYTIIAVDYVIGDGLKPEQAGSFNELANIVKEACEKPPQDAFEKLREWAAATFDCKFWLSAARDGFILFLNERLITGDTTAKNNKHGITDDERAASGIILKKIHDYFSDKTNIRVLISEPAQSLYSLSDSMLSLESCRYRFFFSDESENVFIAESVVSADNKKEATPTYEHPDIEQICAHVFSARMEEAKAALYEAESVLIERLYPPPIIDAYVNLLVTRLALFMDEHFYMGHDLYMLGETLKPALKRIRIKKLTQILLRTLRLVHNTVQNAAKEADMGIVSNVVVYLKEHYNEKITIRMVSERFFINTAYLGQLFKRKTGVSFHEYLAELRMEKAKQLLTATNKSIADISAEIGFEDPNYFSARFGKTEGITPREYRSMMQNALSPGDAL